MSSQSSHIERANQEYQVRALVLQGGGALGSYQAGVYQGLHAAGLELTDITGISIGALNVAIIAGSAPEQRVANLRRFWDTICQPNLGTVLQPGLEKNIFGFNDMARGFMAAIHAGNAMAVGQNGFFKPRFPSPLLGLCQDPAKLSFYDTGPLKETLESICDFERINHGDMRVSVGAVNARTGNFIYFDNRKMPLKAEHFMASGALPPGFPPIEIDGEYYWDGGLVSNTPLSEVIDPNIHRDTLIFQVDLWSAMGDVPHNIQEVDDRLQDIRYSSRTRMITDNLQRYRKMQRLLHNLLEQISDDVIKREHFCQLAQELACNKVCNIIHLIYRNKPYEQTFRDYQFGALTMQEHWHSGLEDINNTLAQAKFLAKPDNHYGFVTHDVHRRQ